jgi:peptidoglycan/xylan/chitin deacetylase (PgdA/CDA1 family)
MTRSVVRERAVSLAGQLLRSTRRNRLVILIYHRVRPARDAMLPRLPTAAEFDRRMELLREHCNPVPLAEALGAMERGSLPSRAVAVTFDDGYSDNVEVALPILVRRGIPATFFIATGFLDGGAMWNDAVVEAVRRAPGSELNLGDIQLGCHALGTERSRSLAAAAINRSIKHLDPDDRQACVDAVCARVGVDPPPNFMMTAAGVRRLADAGMEIGAHTVNHPILRSVSEEKARGEIRQSRDTLQSIIGKPVTGFAYPNGRPELDYTARDRKIVEEEGFAYAVSTKRGAASTKSERFQLPRFTPWDADESRWLARLLLEFRSPA